MIKQLEGGYHRVDSTDTTDHCRAIHYLLPFPAKASSMRSLTVVKHLHCRRRNGELIGGCGMATVGVRGIDPLLKVEIRIVSPSLA